MNNMPEVKIGIVAVSRDCFPESLSVNRRKKALEKAYHKKIRCKGHLRMSDLYRRKRNPHGTGTGRYQKAGCNALCVYLGNFGPEISETLLAKHFDGPKMFIKQQKKHRITFARDVEMHTAVC